ncbi:uncharacterized protein [Macrobrachium rosenbergii]|uniref:uncharacterized protein n=1 Tax=Macrobrachium rosenbergii TaxID=79674 RepID=UPI0034D5A190
MALALTLGTLGAAAIAGAIGLGIAGLAVLHSERKGDRRKNKKRRNNLGGLRQDSYRRRGARVRRAVSGDSATAVQNLLQVIREEDVTGCGLKLVCELAGARAEELGTEERAILDLIGPAVPPGEGLLASGGARDYMWAKAFGQQRGNCAQAFPDCHFSGAEIMATVRNFLP